MIDLLRNIRKTTNNLSTKIFNKLYKNEGENNEHKLLTRHFDKKLITLTFDEYINYINNKTQAKLFSDLTEATEETEETRLLDLEVDYYYFCFEELINETTSIIILWQKWLSALKTREIDTHLYGIILNLAKITRDSRISWDDKVDFDSELIEVILNKFKNRIILERDFNNNLSDILDWFDFRINSYIPCMQITYSPMDLEFFLNLHNNYPQEISNLKSERPLLFIKFYSLYKKIYIAIISIDDLVSYKYRLFYKNIILETIIVCRDIGYHDMMSETIYSYNKIKFEKSPRLSWFLDFFVGYGEKPLRIIRLALIYHFLFLVLFLFPIWQFSSLPNHLLEKIISIIYFNNTTMLTVGYGDIYPTGTITKIIVMVQQTVGFTITGSFITLWLRKIFRF